MNRSELIGDRIEEIIGRMFKHFSSFDSGVTQYSMFYNPRRHASWFIIIFFADKTQLSSALKNGVCYQIYSYVNNELDNITETSNIERSISFESGNQPKKQSDIDNLFELLLKKQESLKAVAGQENVGKCGNCGHDFDKHQLLCNLNEVNTAPTEGWIICPDEECSCFQTWSANYKATIE